MIPWIPTEVHNFTDVGELCLPEADDSPPNYTMLDSRDTIAAGLNTPIDSADSPNAEHMGESPNYAPSLNCVGVWLVGSY